MSTTAINHANPAQTVSISGLILKFILLDVLFFPYPPGLPVTFGVLAALVWPLFALKQLNARYFLLAVGIIILAILSLFRFLVFAPASSSGYLVPNVINFGILCFMAIVVLMTVTTMNQKDAPVVSETFILTALKGYILFKAGLAVIFLGSTTQYFAVRALWTFSGTALDVGDLSTHTRYTGTLSDPNNFGCIMVAVVAFVIFRQPTKIFQSFVLLFLTAISVVATMSVTAISALLVVTVLFASISNLPGSMGSRLILRVVLVSMTPLLMLVAYELFRDNPVVEFALYRITNSSTESRFIKFEILAEYDKILPALFIGEGPTIVWNGQVFAPHIGHIYMILGFGIPAYLLFLAAFFPVSPRLPLPMAVFFLPIFFGFSLNVGIYEPRFGGIWALLAGLYVSEVLRQRRTRLSEQAPSPLPATAELRAAE